MASLGIDVKKVASHLKVTPSVLLYAAWSMVLSAAHSTEDVVMGVTLSGRDSPVPGILEMSGPTLMIAPLRVKIDQSSSFEAHLAQVQQTLWDVASHAHCGLRNIFKANGQSKDLFDSMVNFLIKISPPLNNCGLNALPFTNLGSVEHAKLELNNENLDRITLTSKFEMGFAQHLVDLAVSVLQKGSGLPTALVKDLLPAASPNEPDLEITTVLPCSLDESIVSDKTSQYAYSGLGYSAFMKMAAEHPSRSAVHDISGNEITYAGLAIKIDQLAGVLRSKGVKHEQVIPMLLEKSINTIIYIWHSCFRWSTLASWPGKPQKS
jgi:non-ribosomal peptide synthetase component F